MGLALSALLAASSGRPASAVIDSPENRRRLARISATASLPSGVRSEYGGMRRGVAMSICVSKALSALVVGVAMTAASAFAAESPPPGSIADAERLLKDLLTRVPELKTLHLKADPDVVLVLDSDVSGPRIRMSPGVPRDVYARYPGEAGDRVLTVLLAGLIGRIQAGQPIGGQVLYTLDQLDESSCRAVRLLGDAWYRRYLVEVIGRDETSASGEVDRLLSKCS